MTKLKKKKKMCVQGFENTIWCITNFLAEKKRWDSRIHKNREKQSFWNSNKIIYFKLTDKINIAGMSTILGTLNKSRFRTNGKFENKKVLIHQITIIQCYFLTKSNYGT